MSTIFTVIGSLLGALIAKMVSGGISSSIFKAYSDHMRDKLELPKNNRKRSGLPKDQWKRSESKVTEVV